MENLAVLDTIANLKPIARERLTLVEAGYKSIEQLPIGQAGTILEVYSGELPRYSVEFADLHG